MTILWILNLFNGTGLGMVYQTTEKTRSLIYIAAIFIIIMKCREHHLWVDKQDFIIFGEWHSYLLPFLCLKETGQWDCTI